MKFYLFQILSLISKCKNRTTPLVFNCLFALKPPTKYALRTDDLLSEPLKSFANFRYLYVLPICGKKVLQRKPISVALNILQN